MLGKIELHYQGAEPKLTRTDWNAIKREVFQDAGEFWHEEIRPKHFTNAAESEYNYTPRKGGRGRPHPRGFKASYQGRKLRLLGHTRPLVFTGEGQKLSQVQDVRVTSKRVRIILPRKFNFRNPHSPIIMREELTAISDRDEDQIIARADKLTGEKLNEVKRTQKVRAA